MVVSNSIKVKKAFLITHLLLGTVLWGQQESYYSLYQYNMQVVNPAYAGAESAHQLSLLSRRQWSQMDNAPNTLAFAYSSARENNVGLGISVVSDKLFVEQQTFAYVDFSYRLTLGDGQKLYLGLKGGGNFYKADPTSLSTYDPVGDPLQLQRNRFIPNVGAGAYYKAEKYWFAFSIPRLFGVNRGQEDIVTAKDRMHVYASGGAAFSVGDQLALKPNIMLRKVKGLPLSSELTAMVSWQNRFDVGVSARSNSSMALLSLVNFNGIQIGYSYETPTSNQLSGLGLKTHEVVLRFQFGEADNTSGASDAVPEEE